MALNSRKAFHRQRMGKRDANHAKVRDGLRKLGLLVADLAGAGDGIADLCVLRNIQPGQGAALWCWLEVKTAKGTLTPAQVELRAAWAARGVTVHVVRSLEEALAVLYPNVRARVEANARAVNQQAAATVAAMGEAT